MSDVIKISELMKGGWKDYSVSTCSERAIPSVVDGFKPVQRFLLLSGIQNCKNKFEKVNGIGSVVAKYGYEHGEASAVDALTKMGQNFTNNIPIFEGEGNFGNVLSPKSYAQPRYIFCKLQSYIDSLFKDTELAPDDEDPEIKTKKYYLPLIPLVLCNGIEGIATGYACNIAPHDPISIIDTLIGMANGEKYKSIKPKYYNFKGDILKNGNDYILSCPLEKVSSTQFKITDMAIKFHDYDSYEKFLRKLLDKGIIQNYDNNSVEDRYEFVVTFKRGTNYSIDEVRKILKIDFEDHQNITTITEDGKLKIWDKVDEIVKWFYSFRIPFIQTRIDNKIKELEKLIAYYTGFIKFINDIINNKLDLKHIDETQLLIKLKSEYLIPDDFLEKVMNSPLRTLTVQKIKGLNEKLLDKKSEFSYYSSTTKEKEFIKDLLLLKEAYNNYLNSKND